MCKIELDKNTLKVLEIPKDEIIQLKKHIRYIEKELDTIFTAFLINPDFLNDNYELKYNKI